MSPLQSRNHNSLPPLSSALRYTFPYTTLFRSSARSRRTARRSGRTRWAADISNLSATWPSRSEEHTSELQSRGHLVCRLLLEKKNNHRGHSVIRAHHSTRIRHENASNSAESLP